MADNRRKLTKDAIKEFLDKADAQGEVSSDVESKELQSKLKRSQKVKSGRGPKKQRSDRRVGQTLAGRVTQVTGAFTGTLAERITSEVGHSDFKKRVKAFSIGLGTAIVIAILAIVIPAPLTEAFEKPASDLRSRYRFQEVPETANLLHLDIDDNSISTLGRWPWDRKMWASMVRAAKAAGMDALVFDVEFFDPQQLNVDLQQVAAVSTWVDEVLRSYLDARRKVDVQVVNELQSTLGEADKLRIEALKNKETEILQVVRGVAETLASAKAALGTSEADENARQQVANVEAKLQDALEAAAKLRDFSGLAEPIKKAAGALGAFNDEVTRDNPGSIVDELDAQQSLIIQDFDEIFAAAVREAEIVYLPFHFERSELVKRDRIVAWNPELFGHLETAIDKAAQRAGIESVGRDIVAKAIVGKSTTDDVSGKPMVISEELALRASQEQYRFLQSLYVYRKIHSWYLDKDETLIRQHMAEYIDDYRSALDRRTGYTEPLAMFASPGGGTDWGKPWASVAAETLQKFYTWKVFRNDYATRDYGHDRPWVLPVTQIQGYDPKAHDAWAVRQEAEGEGVLHFRDTEFEPAIFRLADPAIGSGFVAIEKDADGILRAVPLLAVYEETVTGERVVMLQLAFKVMLDRVQADFNSISFVLGQYVSFLADEGSVESLRQGKPPVPSGKMTEHRIAINARGFMEINWVGGPASHYHQIFQHIPIANVFDLGDILMKQNENSALLGQVTQNLVRGLSSEMYVETQTLENFFQIPLIDLRDDLRKQSGIPYDIIDTFMEGYRGLVTKFWQDVAAGSVDDPSNAERLDQLAEEVYQILLTSAGLDSQVTIDLIGDAWTTKHGVSLSPEAVSFLNRRFLAGVKSTLGRPIRSTRANQLRRIDKELSEAKKADLYLACLAMWQLLLREGSGFEEAEKTLKERFLTIRGVDVTSTEELRLAEVANYERSVGLRTKEALALRRYLFGSGPVPQTVWDPADGATAEYFNWEIPLLVEAGVIEAAKEIPEGEALSGFGPASWLAANEIHLLTQWEPSDLVRRARFAHANRAEIEHVLGGLESDRAASIDRIGEHLRGKTGLIGAAATGLGDLIATPVQAEIAGPSLHTNTFNTVLYGIEYRGATLRHSILVVIGILLICITSSRFSAVAGSLMTVGVLLLYLTYDKLLSDLAYTQMSTIRSLGTMIAPYIAVQGYRYGVEYKDKLKIKKQFALYMSEEAVEAMQKNPDFLKLGGDECEMAVFFSDLVGFTPISESMTPSKLIMFLNDYMNRMCEPIKDSGGYIDKFIGDAIMAFWGRPNPLDDYSIRACKSAIRDVQALKRWNTERAERGELLVGVRIGIATGLMVAGNMGTDYRRNYTAIGDTVNLAARLEGANKQYGTQIMINELTYKQAQDQVVAHLMDNIAVKGKKKGVPVYHLIGLTGETEPKYVKGCAIYNEAFAEYQQMNFVRAHEGFKDAKDLLPPAYQVPDSPCDLLIERCQLLADANAQERMDILHLPSIDAEWDGVWKLTSK